MRTLAHTLKHKRTSISPHLGRLEVLAVGVARVAHGGDRVVVELQTEGHALVERVLRLVCRIEIKHLLQEEKKRKRAGFTKGVFIPTR